MPTVQYSGSFWYSPPILETFHDNTLELSPQKGRLLNNGLAIIQQSCYNPVYALWMLCIDGIWKLVWVIEEVY